MSLDPRPTMFVIAGPNGAGKTTFYETVLKTRLSAPFINADVIQRDELNDRTMQASYEAARIASEGRRAMIAERRSFVAESVFSHESKLALLQEARNAGFRIVVFHLQLGSADLAAARVRERVAEGGHDAPEEKIRSRFERNQHLIRKAVLIADAAAVYDSSALNAPPRMIMKLSNHVIEFVAARRPAWFERLYGDLLKSP